MGAAVPPRKKFIQTHAREVQNLDIAGDGADQALSHREPRDVDRALVEAERREQLEGAISKQVNRADLAPHRLGDDLHDLVQFRLSVGPRGHHVVKPGQYLPG